MKRYSLLLGIVTTTLLTNQAVANETTFGIGAAVNDRVKIYLPINTGRLLIEPTLAYIKNKDDNSSPFSFNGVHETIQIGTGIFLNNKTLKNTNVYYGARIGYIKTENESDFSGNSITTSKSDGYFIAPTIGAEYFLISNFSIGLDISINYSNTDGDTTNNFNGTTETSSTKNITTQTLAEIIARYHF